MSNDANGSSTGPGQPGAQPTPPERRDAAPSSSSGDDLAAYLTAPRPDPMLGSYEEQRTAEAKEPLADRDASMITPLTADSGDPTLSPISSTGGASVGSFDPDTGVPLQVPRRGNRAGDRGPLALPDLLASTSSSSERPVFNGISTAEPARSGLGDSGDLPELAESRRSSLLVLCLASYASAVTIGLIWVLWTGRKLPPPRPAAERAEASAPSENGPDPGIRADRSRRLAPPTPLPAERLTTLGKPLRVGAIEVTPREVGLGRVVLQHVFGRRELRKGSAGASRLELEIRNVSRDIVLAPLDEAFVRGRPGADPDSYIEAGADGSPILPYPLAVESEWTIVGQEFRELGPGERFRTAVVSVGDVESRLAPEMTWRIRLRTGIQETEEIGVHFRRSDITRLPEPFLPPDPLEGERSPRSRAGQQP